MSCHGCAEQFGFLRKEHGCPKCKFSYCKKCLRFQITDQTTSKQISVCFKCQQIAQKGPTEPISVLSALHRLESMDDPAKPPITVYHQPTRAVRLRELKRGLSIEDQNILERLESLKKDDSILTTGRRSSTGKPEEEIAERLARLKDEEYKPETKSNAALRIVKPETEEDVIAKFAAEVEMDSKYEASVVSDIEARLARLRGESVHGEVGESSKDFLSSSAQQSTKIDSLTDPEDLTEEEQVQLIMKKLQDELALDQRVGTVATTTSGSGGMEVDISDVNQSPTEQLLSDEDDDIDVDDLCGICSEKRATLKCEECDNDIFCNACFQELHRELGEVHKASQIKQKK